MLSIRLHTVHLISLHKFTNLIMLELDVVPERSLGCEQWEFILGMYRYSCENSEKHSFMYVVYQYCFIDLIFFCNITTV